MKPVWYMLFPPAGREELYPSVRLGTDSAASGLRKPRELGRKIPVGRLFLNHPLTWFFAAPSGALAPGHCHKLLPGLGGRRVRFGRVTPSSHSTSGGYCWDSGMLPGQSLPSPAHCFLPGKDRRWMKCCLGRGAGAVQMWPPSPLLRDPR